MEHYKAGADEEALSWLTEQSRKIPAQVLTPTSVRWPIPLRGKHQYGDVSRFLRQCRAHVSEVASVPGAEGVLLTFDDFLWESKPSASAFNH